MQKKSLSASPASSIIAHMATLTPSKQETMGMITVEILREGKSLNRKSICSKLLVKLEKAISVEEEEHLQSLINMLFER